MKLGNVTRATPEERLLEPGFELLPVHDTAGDFVAHMQIGSIIHASGTLPWINGGPRFAGLIGGTLAAGQGYAAFQLLALNGLSLLKSITGDLSKIKRIHRVEGAGGATADFHDVPRALSGASHLATRVFGEKGAHLRMIHSNLSMPTSCAALVISWTEVE